MRKLFCLLAVLCFFTPAIAQDAPDDGGIAKAISMSDALYPYSAGWRKISDLRPLKREEVADVAPAVADAIKRTNFTLPNVDCEFAKLSFDPEYEELYLGSYRWMDLDGDRSGETDLLYAGLTPCLEGGMTIAFAWDGTRFKAQPQELAEAQALRIGIGKDAGLASISGGCCGDPVNVYRLGKLSNPMATGVDYEDHIISALEDTVAPKKTLEEREVFAEPKNLILRLSPEVKDAYDADRSEVMGHAIFGNQIRVYMPDVEGWVMARQKDAKGRDWAFVVVSAGYDSLVLQDPYRPMFSLAGWTLLSE